MQKIGLFFGTFDPIHIGHEKIAKYFLNKYFDEVWFVITPLNPDKVNENLTDQSIRLEMTQKYCDNELDFKYSDIEFGLPKPNYTADTLYEFKRNYKNLNFSIIMGEDNLVGLENWKNYNKILESMIYVYPRENQKTKNYKLKIITTEKDYNRLSSVQKKNIQFLKIELKIEKEKEFRNFLLKKL